MVKEAAVSIRQSSTSTTSTLITTQNEVHDKPWKKASMHSQVDFLDLYSCLLYLNECKPMVRQKCKPRKPAQSMGILHGKQVMCCAVVKSKWYVVVFGVKASAVLCVQANNVLNVEANDGRDG